MDSLSAVTSGEREPIYRHSYTRTRARSGRRAAVVLFNPVHAGDRLDPTTGKCMTWLAATKGVGTVEFVNVFAYRHPNPLTLIKLAQTTDVVGPANDMHLRRAIDAAELVVVAWGGNVGRVNPARAEVILSWIEHPFCFGLNADGSPVHPNRRGLSTTVPLVPYSPNTYRAGPLP